MSEQMGSWGMKTGTNGIKKRLKQREDMFLRRRMGILAQMAKENGEVNAWDTIRKVRGM